MCACAGTPVLRAMQRLQARPSSSCMFPAVEVSACGGSVDSTTYRGRYMAQNKAVSITFLHALYEKAARQ
jgi:hypothetical protein